MSRELDVHEIIELLHELATVLEARGIAFNLKLVGGAALAFTGMDRRVTRVVDAAYEPAVEVERAAEEIARQRGLERNWLNAHAKAYIPTNAKWVEINLGDLTVNMASKETLLAMKINAARLRDMDDVSFLLDGLGIEDPDVAVMLAEQMYGDDDVAYDAERRADAPLVVEEALGLLRQRGDNQD